MAKLFYITGNLAKYQTAKATCQPYGIDLQRVALEIDEIQSEEAEKIARDKADKAFNLQQQPVVVSDDSWYIPGLNGFPGPYMKSMNTWFSVEDWLHLTRHLVDRRIYLQQLIVYQDMAGQQSFVYKLEGQLQTEPRGTSPHSICCITSLDNGGHSMAEFHEQNKSALPAGPNVWHKFAQWYSDHHDRSSRPLYPAKHATDR
jgi:non-canonical purine NTP pyrophosphatase (RdgB/HAM1 family)